jgi:hypothetical protein
MTVEQIKHAVDSGQAVYWTSKNYKVIKDKHSQYFIMCVSNSYAIGLTHQDDITLNGNPQDFFTDQIAKPNENIQS